MRTQAKIFVAGALLFGLAGACDRDRDSRGTARTTSGPYDRRTLDPRPVEKVTTRYEAEVQRLSTARCDREVRCNNVGGDKRYESRDHCLNNIKTSLQEELNKWDCAGGVRTGQLAECLNAITNEDCGNPIDTVGRLVACRSGDLCSESP